MFKTIDQNIEAEIVEKKSKFIANVFYVESVEEAEEYIRKIKKEHKLARHNCYAFSIFSREGITDRFSDDGEPSGTAGAPMLNIISSKKITNIWVVVTRYFGGILLGTGGLVSCYSNVTLKALEEAKKVKKCRGLEAQVEVEYSNLEIFKYYCKYQEIEIKNIEYLDKIICKIEAENSKIEKIMGDIKLKKLIVNEFCILNEKIISKSK